GARRTSLRPRQPARRALYLGGTEYRIHGTNDPTTFGRQVRLSAYLQNTNERVRRQQAAAFAPFVVPE
ncbi:MAG: hypothetical protein WBM31_24105, partial [Pseudolabrys sp.]